MASDGYTLYYHDLGGRGEYIRLIFVEAGVSFTEVNENMRGLIMGGELGGYPCFAPPVIKKGEFVLAQTPVICKYLGKQFGLWPDTEEDVWHADMVNTTIHDFLAEGNWAFHARNIVDSYFDQIEYTKPHIELFRKQRLNKFLAVLERMLAANNAGNGFVVGNKLTYVDLALFHILRVTEANFEPEYKENKDIPLLKAFRERIAARPNIQAYLKSDKCRPINGYSFM